MSLKGNFMHGASFEFGYVVGRRTYDAVLREGTESFSPAQILDQPVAENALYAVVKARSEYPAVSRVIKIADAFAGLMYELDSEIINTEKDHTYPVYNEADYGF